MPRTTASETLTVAALVPSCLVTVTPVESGALTSPVLVMRTVKSATLRWFEGTSVSLTV